MIGRIFGACAGVLLAAAPAMGQDLKPGDDAPDLHIAEWIKGEPVTEFQSDKTYVVEFWATWCGPCIRGIPHLTELQSKHADDGLTIISVTSEDPRNSLDKVKSFTSQQGDKMGYTVAFDDGRKTNNAWMRAANQNGIPAAFVVSENKVVWIGHPGAMDPVLEEVLAGEFDVAKHAAKERQRADLEKKAMAIMKQAEEAFNAGDNDTVLAKMDEVIALDPQIFGGLALQKYQFISFEIGDQERADAFADSLATGVLKDRPQLLNQLAWFMLTDAKASGSTPDASVALRVAKRAAEATEHEDASILDTVAKAYWESGDKQNAIETQRAAIDAASSEEEAEGFRATLDEYENS